MPAADRWLLRDMHDSAHLSRRSGCGKASRPERPEDHFGDLAESGVDASTGAETELRDHLDTSQARTATFSR